MASSPVEFAAAFERLRTHVGAVEADDSVLLQLLDFWPKLAPLAKNPAYSSYVAEYLAFLETALTNDNLCDLSLAELASLESLGKDVEAREPLLQLIRKQIARQSFFVGKLDEGLAACLRITREDVAFEAGDASAGGLSEFETFHAFVMTFNEDWQATKKLLQELAEEWQAEREFVSTDRIYCLFVQNNGMNERSRGKLRALSGSVEERSRSAQNDEITFDNQLRASDDPIVGVAYQALAATRRYLKSTGYSRLGTSYYHAHFGVTEKRAIYTGDSIGVATALLAYAQLLHTEALRHDHLLPGDVACTGGIDEAGTVTPVNGDSLHAKVERAFFSHIKYLALPSENVTAARKHLEALQSRYPARQLVLLPIASLSAAVNDHNIIRPEKVCIGEFVAKKAVKYSRLAKVQVPMLVVLAYLLLCVIYPKAWVGFDWNPAYASYDKSLNSVEVYNTDSTKLFSQRLECSAGAYAQPPTVCDINGDGLNEVMFTVASPEPCDQRGWLYCYSIQRRLALHEMTLDFKRYCAVPGISQDTTNTIIYDPGIVKVVTSLKEDLIITEASQNMPARTHIRFWNSQGDSIGWYVNKGGIQLITHFDIDGDSIPELFFLGYNNPMGCTALLVLKADVAEGTSPPFGSNHRNTTVGDQLAYVLFPPTDLGEFELETPYNHPDLVGIRVSSDDYFEVYVREADPVDRCPLIYRFNKTLKIDSVVPSDQFAKKRDRLILEGKLPRVDDIDYYEQKKNNVTYWINEKWVTEGELSALGS